MIFAQIALRVRLIKLLTTLKGNSMSDIKMSFAFKSDLHYEEQRFNDSFRFVIFCKDKAQGATWYEDQAELICQAVNNHDRLEEENAQLKAALKKAQTELSEQDFKIMSLNADNDELLAVLIMCTNRLDDVCITEESKEARILINEIIQKKKRERAYD